MYRYTGNVRGWWRTARVDRPVPAKKSAALFPADSRSTVPAVADRDVNQM
ncbi:hypothetical protein V0288_10170 [Pannus brasiliensis CCIBt3594]|uniref:Uncharacterized protein n=1 Tax=Pannus brasiliensis CCIBt3594 TaxID=1427578 RepID=A0AAW9QWU2_9CHRO